MKKYIIVSSGDDGKLNHTSITGVFISPEEVLKCVRLNPIYSKYLSVYINLRIFTFLKGKKKDSIEDVLKLVGLHSFRKTKISKYSPEMKEKVNIASKLLINKTPIKLIEPTKGLDIQGKIEIKNLINEVSFQNNKDFLIYSTDMDELKFICTNIVKNK